MGEVCRQQAIPPSILPRLAAGRKQGSAQSCMTRTICGEEECPQERGHGSLKGYATVWCGAAAKCPARIYRRALPWRHHDTIKSAWASVSPDDKTALFARNRNLYIARHLLGDYDQSIDMWEINREKQAADKTPPPAGRGGQ